MEHKTPRYLLAATSLSLILLCSACATKNDVPETIVSWDAVPAAAQKTINNEAHGQKVSKIEKETKDGEEIYEAKVMNSDGSKTIVKVDDDGKLIAVKKKSAEIEVAWKKVPSAVRKTLTDNAGGQKIEKVEKETDDGLVVYEGKVMKADGSKLIIKVAKDGKLIATKTKKD